MRVPIIEDVTWERLATTLAPYPIYAADGGSGALWYTQIDWRTPSVLIVGNEAHGLSTSARQLAQQTVHIPMRAGIESLNAAMAASIILFEAQRQQMQN
jgi:TrmH family RNA methyltransferase